MKQLLTYLLLLISIYSDGQDLVEYKDTINNFSIGIPIGWRYGVLKNYPSIKIFAQQVQKDTSNKLFVNYNLNIYNSSDSTFENAYTDFISSISQAINSKIIDSGNTVINTTRYEWIIEGHQNKLAPISMRNYVFMTFKKGVCYVLTMVAPEKEFDLYKNLFDKIAGSFKL